MHSLATVQAMLLGFALENLLKGLWIKNHRAWLQDEFSLTKNGDYVGIPSAGEHKLLQLATAVRITVSRREADVLNRLTAFVKHAGRYPIATTAEQMRPKRVNGRDISPGFITSAELRLAKDLANRLINQIES